MEKIIIYFNKMVIEKSSTRIFELSERNFCDRMIEHTKTHPWQLTVKTSGQS